MQSNSLCFRHPSFCKREHLGGKVRFPLPITVMGIEKETWSSSHPYTFIFRKIIQFKTTNKMPSFGCESCPAPEMWDTSHRTHWLWVSGVDSPSPGVPAAERESLTSALLQRATWMRSSSTQRGRGQSPGRLHLGNQLHRPQYFNINKGNRGRCIPSPLRRERLE